MAKKQSARRRPLPPSPLSGERLRKRRLALGMSQADLSQASGVRERDAKGRICRLDANGRALNVHTLRHTHATRLMRARVQERTAMYLLGLSSPKMLLTVYQHAELEDARSALDLLPSLGTGGKLPSASAEGTS